MKKPVSFRLFGAAIFIPRGIEAKVIDPNVYINEYNSLVSAQGENSRSYDYVMAVYNEYMPVLNNDKSSYSDKQVAASGLQWLFPYLMNGAFYYSECNNQTKALAFAEAYVNTYIHPAMQDTRLEVNQAYPTLAYFAASNNYNRRNYDKAIRYLDAYIKSGDTKNLSDAFNYTAKAYINTNRNNEAKQILAAGLNLFPSDLQMLTTVINLLAETKSDDSALQKYVSQALRYKPNEIGLLNIQAQLYERNQNFENAAEYYRKLQSLKPNNLEVARHLGINLYNSGIYLLNSGGSKGSAQRKLNEAAKILSDVVISDPLAINYIYALANTYSILGDKDNLAKINSKLTTLGRTPIAENVSPQLLSVNNEHVAPSSITVAPRVEYTTPVVQNVTIPQVPQTPVTQASVPMKSNVAISDVDMNIPVNKHHNENAFAVIIANNDYKKVADVANADNDGRIFAEYCNKVLGIPESHIRTHYNVTYGELLDAVEDIKSIALAKRGDLDVILYYAGHGVPDEKNGSAYILPVDADGKQLRLCYPLSELYAELGAMKANNTFVFLDACFSDSERAAEGMLIPGRTVAIDVDPNEVEGKLVIFSAATGEQSAMSYDEQNHGMFTYFLLKKLKETKGNIELGTLATYLNDNVMLESQLRNKKQQMPTVIVGAEYDSINWKKLRLTR